MLDSARHSNFSRDDGANGSTRASRVTYRSMVVGYHSSGEPIYKADNLSALHVLFVYEPTPASSIADALSELYKEVSADSDQAKEVKARTVLESVDARDHRGSEIQVFKISEMIKFINGTLLLCGNVGINQHWRLTSLLTKGYVYCPQLPVVISRPRFTTASEVVQIDDVPVTTVPMGPTRVVEDLGDGYLPCYPYEQMGVLSLLKLARGNGVPIPWWYAILLNMWYVRRIDVDDFAAGIRAMEEKGKPEVLGEIINLDALPRNKATVNMDTVKYQFPPMDGELLAQLSIERLNDDTTTRLQQLVRDAIDGGTVKPRFRDTGVLYEDDTTDLTQDRRILVDCLTTGITGKVELEETVQIP